MSNTDNFSARWTRLMHRVAARRSARAIPATGFTSTPEPRTIGLFARGQTIGGGQFPVCGTSGERAQDRDVGD